ncbi:MAG: hypothetical protein KJ072_21950 [Verrucomicrobia bacterium]|nr:hypothetical protein [Verrucomicrobiota bacterium]
MKHTLPVLTALLLAPLAALQAADASKPVKVFILAGQSNMEGHAGVQTLDRLGEHPTHGYLLRLTT